MKERDPYLKMFLLEKSDRAVHVCDQDGSFHVWLPSSLIGYSRMTPVQQPGKQPSFLFTLPEWKVDQADLWAYVTEEK